MLVGGFGGMRHDETGLRFAPRLPVGVSRMEFCLRLAARTLCVDVTADVVRYQLTGEPALHLHHHGEPLTVAAGTPETCPIPPQLDAGPPPNQPAHREPGRDV